jgi:hypothetical protein
VNAYDIDHPLPLDVCDRCSFDWAACICDPARPYRQPTPEEIETAREERLSRLERQTGGIGAP